jgi:hypothetical protein
MEVLCYETPDQHQKSAISCTRMDADGSYLSNGITIEVTWDSTAGVIGTVRKVLEALLNSQPTSTSRFRRWIAVLKPFVSYLRTGTVCSSRRSLSVVQIASALAQLFSITNDGMTSVKSSPPGSSYSASNSGAHTAIHR